MGPRALLRKVVPGEGHNIKWPAPNEIEEVCGEYVRR